MGVQLQQQEKGMSVFCKPFTTAKISYFDCQGLISLDTDSERVLRD